ncbi:MAG: hypothetical protein ACF8NJ_05055, partial [Phycisphaerales bacterium JB038]
MSDLDHFRAFVADRDIPCPSCDYSLRDLTEPRCPECGEQLTIGITLSEPHIGRFIAIWTPLLAGLGFGGVVSLWGLFAGAAIDELAPLLLLVLLTVPSAFAAVQQRRRIRRLESQAFAGLVAMAWILPTLFVLWFMAT